jgi:hypothetical protein
MMAFDEAKFRAAAKAAGYSDKEIDAELGTPAGAVSPQAIASGPETAAKFDAEGEAKRAEIVQGFEESSKTDASQSPMTLPGVLTSPVALVTGATVLGALGGYAARPVIKGIKERYMTKAPEIDRTIEIPTGGFFDVAPDATLNPLGQPTAETIDKVQRAAQLAEANRQLGIGGNQPVPPTAPVAAPVAPPEPISTPITAAPIDAPAATPTAGPGSPVTSIINDTVKEMIQQTPDPVTGAAPAQPVAPPQDLLTGTGKPAFAGMGQPVALNKKGQPKFKPEYASVADVPSGYAFVPGADKIDTLRQNLGQAPYTEFFTKRDFPLTNESAIEQSKEINRLLGKPTRAELIAAGLPPAVNTPGITQLTNAPKGSGMGTKTARVAGTLGALIAIPDLAKAETAGQQAMAGANLLEAVMPPGFMMSGAGEGSGAVPSFDQAMLLGSPYAQTEIAKKRRQALEYAAKVGGGRGLTPASAYPR